MKKKLIIVAVGALVVCGLLLSSGVFADVGNNDKNGFQVNGPHYNLNIIGVDKHGEVGDSSGHTMFVKLDGKTKIIMTQNESGVFDVVDRNGLDGRAEFNIAPGHYNVYARALGKPGGKAKITAYGNFTDAVEGTKLEWLGCVDINRTKGKQPQSVNINELFYVNVTISTLDEEGNIVTVVYEDFWVFDIPELLEYYWDYNNGGLKLLQVRFYECKLINPDDYGNTAEYPKDYCRWGDGSPIVSMRNGEVITD
jgi:uncharacterized lipoprotein NlpE involved in copper resistance